MRVRAAVRPKRNRGGGFSHHESEGDDEVDVPDTLATDHGCHRTVTTESNACCHVKPSRMRYSAPPPSFPSSGRP